ncbi:TPA: thioredoxin domain-containing protein [Photobacterium damselae]
MKKYLLPLFITAALTGCNDSQANNASSADFSSVQKAQIEKIASDYIIAHPEILVKASETLQKQQMEQQQQAAVSAIIQNTDKLINDKATPFVGPKDAKVNVIEFFDYQCMYCSKIAPVVKELQKANPNVRFIFKETPIFANRWEASKYAADMGNWIFEQKGSAAYEQYHNAIFATRKDEGNLTKVDVDTAAKSVGVDTTKMNLDNSFMQNFKLFSELGFQGTPALIVMPTENANKDNVKVINGFDPQGLKNAIADLTAKIK